MSKDTYSDTHVIHALSGSDIYLHADAGDVRLSARGSNGDVKIYADNQVDVNAAEACIFFAKDYIQLRSQGGAGIIEITGDERLELNGAIISMVSKEFSLKAQDGPIDISNVNTGDDILINAGADLKMSAPGFIEIKSTAKLDMGSSGDIRIGAGADMQLVGQTALHLDSKGVLDIQCKQDILIEAGMGMLSVSGDVTIVPHPNGICDINGNADVSGDLKVQGDVILDSVHHGNWPGIGNPIQVNARPASGSSRFVMEVYNHMDNPQGTANGILIDLHAPAFFPWGGTPTAANNWMRFSYDGSWKGAIQGTNEIIGGLGNGYYGLAGAFAANPIFPVGGIAGPLLTAEGNAQFVSGNADFGEFFEVGDEDEWRMIDRNSRPESRILGLPEGIVVWVIGEKFFRKSQEGIGVPMLITKRAVMVGSAKPNEKSPDDSAEGEVLSFIGKLPVLVKGAVEVGDLILPVEGESYCQGLSKSDANLQDYMKALGTALGSCPEETILPSDHPTAPNEKSGAHLLMCAVGVK